MKKYVKDHSEFMTVFTEQMRLSFSANVAQEQIVCGAVQLFWENSKNVAYLNHALQYARGRRGMRTNAVKAFLKYFTGAKMDGDKFGKGGSLKACPPEFDQLESWLDWADKEAAEPEYNHKAFVLSIVKTLEQRQKKAQAANDERLVGALSTSLDLLRAAE